MGKVIVVIPTYNEADNLSAISEEIFSQTTDQTEILIVDDNSPDGTGLIADKLANQFPGRFHVIHRKGKQGLGTAYITGFQEALRLGADFTIQMDADFSHSPRYISTFLSMMEKYDVIVGSRYVDGGRVDKQWHGWRLFLSWWANAVWTRLMLGVSTKDATAGFKCWRRSALDRINFNQVRSNGYIFQVEMCYIAEKLNFRICEVPIYFEDRRVGQSKMNMFVKVEAALRVFDIRFRHRNLNKGSLLVESEYIA